MATETTNLKLNKPDKTDFYNIDLVNTNMDKIDEAVTGKASKDDIPKSLPANGGNADTVNGFTVESNVPANAKFTDTIYTHPATHPASMITGLPTSLPANGGNADTVDGWHMNLAVDAWGIKPICAGTSDMVAGTTGLSQGHVYIVYE
ncbi:hypothetical protein [Anaerosporobacter sp.]|uniref:hypothetical protein n=1 Tax=Anaerosporobacter sp. TaxID=1872529 RepID=UPI0028A12946|nr:hypothetical protein [Anaerosporobacter sp.]